MSFKFKNLMVLYNDMKLHEETRAIFPLNYNNRNFSCLFLTDISPYSLVLFALGNFNFAIEILIHDDFTASTYIENYRDLVNFLGIKYDPNHTFKPTDFFEYINRNIPAFFTNRPNVGEVITAISIVRKIEHGEQPYLCGTRRNTKGANVTQKNYEKTRLAFGEKIAQLLKQNNISTCWSDNEREENLEMLNSLLSTL